MLKTRNYRFYDLPYFEIFFTHPSYKLIAEKKDLRLANRGAYNQLFSQLIASKFSLHFCIYTDASKQIDICGVAFFIEPFHIHKIFRLPPSTSIFSAELLAILFSLRFIINSPLFSPSPILVISDSLSAISAITNPVFKKKFCPITLHIRNSLQYLLNFLGSPVNFLWVPSHSGITGNEFADHLAGSVSESTPTKATISLHDVISENKKLLFNQWNSSYKSMSNPNSFFFQLQPEIPPLPWYRNVNLNNRKNIIMLCRLRFGHTGLPAHLHRFIPSIDPYCPLHPQDELPADPNHILFSCSKLSLSQKLFESQLIALNVPRPWSLLSLLADSKLYVVISHFLRSLPPVFQI